MHVQAAGGDHGTLRQRGVAPGTAPRARPLLGSVPPLKGTSSSWVQNGRGGVAASGGRWAVRDVTCRPSGRGRTTTPCSMRSAWTQSPLTDKVVSIRSPAGWTDGAGDQHRLSERGGRRTLQRSWSGPAPANRRAALRWRRSGARPRATGSPCPTQLCSTNLTSSGRRASREKADASGSTAGDRRREEPVSACMTERATDSEAMSQEPGRAASPGVGGSIFCSDAEHVADQLGEIADAGTDGVLAVMPKSRTASAGSAQDLLLLEGRGLHRRCTPHFSA